jgi:hypothetical protein
MRDIEREIKELKEKIKMLNAKKYRRFNGGC